VTKIIDDILKFFHRLGAWCCLFMVLITAQQVIARYFFSASSIAMQELEWHLFGTAIMLSVAWTWKLDEHVRVDIFYGRWSKRRQAFIDLVGILCFAMPTCLILIWFGASYAADSLQFNQTIITDHWARAWFPEQSLWYAVASPIEIALRSFVLQGESSPDPGGLSGRWLIKAMIPLAGVLLSLQGLNQLLRTFKKLMLETEKR
jgi:TRAP-type mannitol/chloroaromatic compound transport system permease small subunit